MEKVASTVLFPCKYSSGGCVMTLLHTEKVIELRMHMYIITQQIFYYWSIDVELFH